MLLAFELVVAACCVGMLMIGLSNIRRVRQDARLAARVALPKPLPFISVCVPARNEARNIRACLESLARQDYRNGGAPSYEVIMLDDCSDDGTLAIAREVAAGQPHLRVMQGRPLEPSWIGKPHACMQMAEVARGEWLLFTDADTQFAPHALRQALRLAIARDADLLSGLPAMEVRSIWERLSVPMLGVTGTGLLSFALVGRRGNHLHSAASGAFLFFRRSAYEALGGHHRVFNNIVEDIGLARETKRAGMRLIMTDVSKLISCRMYASFNEVWEGFTKNFNKTFPGGMILVAIGYLLACFLLPWILFLFGPGWGLSALQATWLPLACILATGALRAVIDRQTGRTDWLGLLLMPLAAIFIAIIGLRSYSRALLRHSTPWRGRHYELWQH